MSKIVFTIITENERANNKHYDICLESWKNWTQLNNIPLFVYKHTNSEIDARWFKYKAFEILKSRGLEYEYVLYVDSDTIVSKQTKFDFNNSNICAVENFGSLDHVIRSIENYGRFVYPYEDINYNEYFNTGLMLFNKSHIEFLAEFCNWRKNNWSNILSIINTYKSGEDQTFFNAFCKLKNIKIDLLPFKYNIQDLITRECFRLDARPYFFLDFIPDGIWHFNAFPYPKETIEEIYNILWQ